MGCNHVFFTPNVYEGNFYLEDDLPLFPLLVGQRFYDKFLQVWHSQAMLTAVIHLCYCVSALAVLFAAKISSLPVRLPVYSRFCQRKYVCLSISACLYCTFAVIINIGFVLTVGNTEYTEYWLLSRSVLTVVLK